MDGGVEVSRNAVFRLVAFAVLLGALRLTGLVSFDLPWRDPSFQTAGATVILYLVWSTAFPRPAGGSMSLETFAPYAVLLVSAVDGLMLGLTPFPGPAAARWAGPAALAAGTVLGALRRQRRPADRGGPQAGRGGHRPRQHRRSRPGRSGLHGGLPGGDRRSGGRRLRSSSRGSAAPPSRSAALSRARSAPGCSHSSG